MTLFSVLTKDMLGRMRSWKAALIVGLHLSMLSAVALAETRVLQGQSGFGLGGAVPGPQQGLVLFDSLASFELLLIIFLTPGLTAATISGERERRTFDLLLLTRLSGLGIVVGKLLGTLSFLLLVVFGSLPVFSLVFLFGGVTPSTLVRVYALYVAVATALATTGIFASALAHRPQVSIAISYTIAFALVFGTSLAATILYRPMPYKFGVPPAVPLAAWLAAAANPLAALASILPQLGYGGGMVFAPVLMPSVMTSGSEPPLIGGAWHLPLWELHVGMDAVAALCFLGIAAWAVRPPQWARRRSAGGRRYTDAERADSDSPVFDACDVVVPPRVGKSRTRRQR